MLRTPLIGAVLTLAGLCGNAEAARVDRDMIPDSATAIKVASAILETYMGRDRFAAMIKKGSLKAQLADDTWTVFSWPPNVGHEEKLPNGGTSVTVMAGSDSPVIELSRRDAQVIDITFSK